MNKEIKKWKMIIFQKITFEEFNDLFKIIKQILT